MLHPCECYASHAHSAHRHALLATHTHICQTPILTTLLAVLQVVRPSASLQDTLQQLLHNPSTKPQVGATGSNSKSSGAVAAATGPVASLLFGLNSHSGKHPTDTPAYEFTGAAISDDGQTIVVTPALKRIFVSRDGGATFTPATISKPWSGVAISSSGQHIAAIILGNEIFTSSDYGVTWSSASVPSSFWLSIASDNSGQQLVASSYRLGGGNSTVYTSSDGGATWQDSAQGVLQSNKQTFIAVASNGDGSKLLATSALDTGSIPVVEGAIYSSADGGGSWSKTDVPAAVFWLSVAAAEDF
jgi:hypothetical protein